MANGSPLSDFVGYSVGVPLPPADVGYIGLLDFTGIPIGVGASTPPTPAPDLSASMLAARLRMMRLLQEDEELLIL